MTLYQQKSAPTQKLFNLKFPIISTELERSSREAKRALPALRREIRTRKVLVLENFIDKDLWTKVAHQLPLEKFARTYYRVGQDHRLKERRLDTYMNLFFNQPFVRHFFNGLSGEKDSVFFGRHYKMRSKTDDHFRWHTDVRGGRKIGVSVNMSVQPFEGGEFELCRWKPRKIMSRYLNTQPQSAIIFLIDRNLKHRVLAPHGPVDKYAFQGWFGDLY